jgi:hypothetical protein
VFTIQPGRVPLVGREDIMTGKRYAGFCVASKDPFFIFLDICFIITCQVVQVSIIPLLVYIFHDLNFFKNFS